jgi:hypothetical protein
MMVLRLLDSGDVSARACQGQACRVQSTLQSQAFQALHAPPGGHSAWPHAELDSPSFLLDLAVGPRVRQTRWGDSSHFTGKETEAQAGKLTCWSHTGSQQLCSASGVPSTPALGRGFSRE